ncbi:MAG: hypothetical protein R3C20_15740 [Planctomycetaceae bacterium]
MDWSSPVTVGAIHLSCPRLADALADGKGFPRGLFWLNRRGSEGTSQVASLLKEAHAKKIQAAVVEIENFDELMADLITIDVKIDDESRKLVLPRADSFGDKLVCPDLKAAFSRSDQWTANHLPSRQRADSLIARSVGRGSP